MMTIEVEFVSERLTFSTISEHIDGKKSPNDN